MIASLFLKTNILKKNTVLKHTDLYGFTEYILYHDTNKPNVSENEIFQYFKESPILYIKVNFILKNISYFNKSFLSSINNLIFIYEILLHFNDNETIEDSFYISINVKNKELALCDEKSPKKIEYKIMENIIQCKINTGLINHIMHINKLYKFSNEINNTVNLLQFNNLKKTFELYKIYCY